MKLNRLSLVLAAVLAVSALPAFAESAVSLLTNLPSTGGGQEAAKVNYLAQSFTVPTGTATAGIAYGLSAIHVDLEKAGAGGQNSYQFRIFTNNTGTVTPNQPLRAIGSFQVVGFTKPAFLVPGTVYSFTVPVIGAVNLVPGSTYWIVLTSTNLSTVNTEGWATSSNAVISPAGATLGATLTNPTLTSANQGTTWSAAGFGKLSLGIDLLTR